MSEEREVIMPSGGSKSILELLDSLPEDQFVDELAKVLDRGHVNARLQVDLPLDTHGEWVPNDPMEVMRKKSLGFQIDDKYAAGNALHSDGTGKPIVGDVIYMTCPMRLKQAYDKLAAKRYEENHGNQKKVRDAKEEKEFKGRTNQPGYINAEAAKVDQSTLESIDQSVITAARAANEAQRQSLSVNTTSGAS
jgi:hypothetical protein